MSRKAREEKAAVAAPAPAKPETKPAAAAAAPAKAESPGEKKLTPMMSGDLPRQPEPEPSRRPVESMTSAHEWADKSPLGFLQRNATGAELEGFVAAVKARQTAASARGPQFTFWHCPKCGVHERMGADQKTAPPCFRCNPHLTAGGVHMTAIVGEAAVAAFIERERVEKARWLATLAKAKELAARRDRDLSLLRKHGM